MKDCSKVHGVFPSTNSIPHLTENSISLDPIRDSGEVVVSFVRVGTYPQGISLP